MTFQFAIDRGGTFTDVWYKTPKNEIKVIKLLSEDPNNYDDAPREAIRRCIEKELGISCPKNEPINADCIEWVRMGTTVATNALLERKGEPCALLINKGFKDLLYIGNQARPNIFDLSITCPEVLYETVIEIDERIALVQEKCQLFAESEYEQVIGTTGEKLLVLQHLNKEKIVLALAPLIDRGIRSLAVMLLHSYLYTEHEKQIGVIAREMGFTHVSLSSEVMPMIRAVPRGFTACADAYLTPCINKYVKGFASGFQDGLNKFRVLFMQSDGGLTPVQDFCGSKAILSGPAGGVVGYALTTYSQQERSPVIGFDMGGTSTDVSRYAGSYEHVFESTTAGVSIQAPQLDINTVAAGGGSQLFFRSGMFVVGPESAGAHPGPVCYRKGGPLTVTDANLVLGRLLPEYFPRIFGPSENEMLDSKASLDAFCKLTQEINIYSDSSLSMQQVALGFVNVANEAMCRPIRALTQAKGYDTSKHILACFGGAGGQHACAIARNLGMSTVFVHKYAGILSAYGMALADVVHECQEPCALEYTLDNFAHLDKRLDRLSDQSRQALLQQGFNGENIVCEFYLHLRYEGTDCALMCLPDQVCRANDEAAPRHGNFMTTFLTRYKTEFGFTLSDRRIRVDDVRVRAIGKSAAAQKRMIERASSDDDKPIPEMITMCFFDEGQLETGVFRLEKLKACHKIDGPAIIIDQNSTILVEPACQACITDEGDIRIKIGRANRRAIGTQLDSIQLAIFSHRFMSTAEQMGRVLQRTSISTNIKERLDFSCALFGPDGGLVANAPHIPVHLGAMQEAVKYQITARKEFGGFQQGQALLSNHPSAGGSHLPDLTVITPVFHPQQSTNLPVFFVANRGHHADIGGATPGSMPPHSKSIFEEGAVFKSFELVKEGVFQDEAVTAELMAPARFPGCSGTRNLRDNLSDLKAQVAANQKGINLVCDLIDEYGLDVVQAYMSHIQDNAEVAVRDMLRDMTTRHGSDVLDAEDFMDDGSRLTLKVSIDPKAGSAIFDFSGTGPEVLGNTNAPRAITFSALIYCLRCLVGRAMPLNQGCLRPISIILPSGSLLSPSDTAAVVGGNVLTSQRIVDVVFRAFGACAASQGCMNNVTFGDDEVGYYETVAGGAGAGPDWDGRSGVHTHMTNTRITDPEILERRYPILLERFSLRANSGGRGFRRGGDGVLRELCFRRPMTLCLLTERRVHRPYGMHGGESGATGTNLLRRKNGQLIYLGGKNSVQVMPGDVFILKTPGGGGYGVATLDSETKEDISEKNLAFNNLLRGSVHEFTLTQESA